MILNDFVLFFSDLLLYSLKSFKLLLIKLSLSCKHTLMDTSMFCSSLVHYLKELKSEELYFVCHCCLLVLAFLLFLSFEK